MAANDLIGRLRHALTQVLSAAEIADGLSLEDRVEIGQFLWWISSHAQGSLTPIKDSLRREGYSRQNGVPGRQILVGHSQDARCIVTIPQPVLKLRPGVDVEELRRLLGDDFNAFFSHTLTPRREFAERAIDRPDLVQTLAKAVDTVTEKPRVTFND